MVVRERDRNGTLFLGSSEWLIQLEYLLQLHV